MREGGTRGSDRRSSNKLRTHLVQKRGSQEPRGDREGCGKRALGEAPDVSLRQGLFSGLCKPVVPLHSHRLGGEWRVGRQSGRERREPQQKTETVFPTKPSGWGQVRYLSFLTLEHRDLEENLTSPTDDETGGHLTPPQYLTVTGTHIIQQSHSCAYTQTKL